MPETSNTRKYQKEIAIRNLKNNAKFLQINREYSINFQQTQAPMWNYLRQYRLTKATSQRDSVMGMHILLFNYLFIKENIYGMEKQQILTKIGRFSSKRDIQIDELSSSSQEQGKQASGASLKTSPFRSSASSMTLDSKSKKIKPYESSGQNTNTIRNAKKTQQPKQKLTKQQLGIFSKNIGNEKLQICKLIRKADMVKLFIQKSMMNNVMRKPVTYDPFESLLSQEKDYFFQNKLKKIPKILENAILILKITIVVLYFFFYPLSLLYTSLADSTFLLGFKYIVAIFNIFDLLQTLSKGYEKENHNIQIEKYLKFRSQKRKKIIFEIAILISTVLSVIMNELNISEGNYLFLGFGLNISHFTEQIHILQDRFLTAAHSLKYWNLCRVMGLNLFVCHLLACILISISKMHPGNSWMTPQFIDQLSWYEQYIWSYYFGTTIILTIGFGDLHANNSAQAFFIIVISFFACVFFGYNINYIGNQINSIKQQETEKNSKLKLLSGLTKKSKVSRHVVEEISKFIEAQSKIKRQFNHEEEKKLLKELPVSLRSSFLQQANQRLFNRFRQFIPLTNSTIERLSLKIQTRFCHPDQLIKGIQNDPSLIILHSGQIGYVCRSKYPSKLKNIIIERLSANQKYSESKLACIDVLANQRLKYDIKSLDYSIIYEMKKGQFQETIKESKKDYEMYKQIIDKCRYKIDYLGLVKCRFCDNKMHTLFQCPKLHFVPFRKTIPLNQIKSKSNFKQTRVQFNRKKIQFPFQIIFPSKQLESRRLISEKVLEIISNPKVEDKRKGKKGQRNMSNDNMLMTMQMVSQIRDDIKSLRRNSVSNFEFTLWGSVDCDEGHNFQNYFISNNPDQICKKQIRNTLIQWTTRIKRKIQKSISLMN